MITQFLWELNMDQQSLDAFKRLLEEPGAIVFPVYQIHPNAGIDAVFMVKTLSGGYRIPRDASGEQIDNPDSDSRSIAHLPPLGDGDNLEITGGHIADNDSRDIRYLVDCLEVLLSALDSTSHSSLERRLS